MRPEHGKRPRMTKTLRKDLSKLLDISENSYLFVLVLVLGLFSVLTWVWLIPQGIFEYNLGVNIFTSSIFTIFTIVFLSLFITFRDNMEWRRIKKAVYLDLRIHLVILFDSALTLTEGGLETRLSFWKDLRDTSGRKERLLSMLKTAKDSKSMKLNPIALTAFLEKRVSIEPWLKVSAKLNEIQLKYPKYLSSNLTLSFVKILQTIWAIDNANQTIVWFRQLPKEEHDLSRTTGIPLSKEGTEYLFREKIMPGAVKTIFEELYALYEEGIEFNYPFEEPEQNEEARDKNKT
jgi:hypothetical protein